MKRLLITSVCLASIVAQAQTWVNLGASEEGTMYLDASSIRTQGAYFKAWNRWVSARPIPVQGSPKQYYSVIQTLSYYDCKSGTVADKQILLYLNVYANSPFYTHFNDEAQLRFDDPVPGTFGQSLVERVCSYKR